jgi:hypothetical protein
VEPKKRSEAISLANAMKTFSEAQRSLFGALEALRTKGADPASPKVQMLIDRHRELMTEYRVREQLVDLMQWNPALTRKYIAVGEQFRNRLKDLCRRFKLGNPAYALSAAFMRKIERDGEWQPLDEAEQAPYRFLAEAASV